MKKTRILLVQNAQTQGNSTKRSLDSTGYDVIWVGSGVSALAAAKQWTIDLVIIDVSLPDIEGGDLCRRFRSRENMRAVPSSCWLRVNTRRRRQTPERGRSRCLSYQALFGQRTRCHHHCRVRTAGV